MGITYTSPFLGTGVFQFLVTGDAGGGYTLLSLVLINVMKCLVQSAWCYHAMPTLERVRMFHMLGGGASLVHYSLCDVNKNSTGVLFGGSLEHSEWFGILDRECNITVEVSASVSINYDKQSAAKHDLLLTGILETCDNPISSFWAYRQKSTAHISLRLTSLPKWFRWCWLYLEIGESIFNFSGWDRQWLVFWKWKKKNKNSFPKSQPSTD